MYNRQSISARYSALSCVYSLPRYNDWDLVTLLSSMMFQDAAQCFPIFLPFVLMMIHLRTMPFC